MRNRTNWILLTFIVALTAFSAIVIWPGSPKRYLPDFVPWPEGDGLNGAVHIFSLGFIDDTLAYTGEGDGSGIEVLDWRQESELPATVWVAVDCALPPAAAGSGAYEIIIDCQTVPSEQTSFGSLRALYR